MDQAQVWGFLILTITGAIGSLFGAYFAAKAKNNSGDVKQVIGAPATKDKDGPTLQQKVDEIHTKADKAIAQNEQIGGDVNGNLSKVWEQMHAWRLEAEKLRAENTALKESIAPLLKPPAVVQVTRQVREEDLNRRKDDK